MTFALIGNQNCGKTTLFNQLTGSSQHVGNFPGVTVEKKEGTILKHKDETVVDLPGIYSLSPYTAEEVVTRDFLLDGGVDAVINIVDATNIERNLYLTLQLLELQLPMVIALNMMDEIRSAGTYIDIKKLSEALDVPIVPVSASKNEGVSELVAVLSEIGKNKKRPKKIDFCEGAVHTAIHSVAHLVEENAAKTGVPIRFAATKIVDGDKYMQKRLRLNEVQLDIVGHIVNEMEENLKTDREAALADMRYEYIEKLCSSFVKKHGSGETKEQKRSAKMDAVLTSKYFGIPIFLGIMFLIFWLTFGVIGSFLSDLLAGGIDWLSGVCDAAMTSWGVNAVIQSLVINGIFVGVGSVLSFLPIIVTLFFFLSILEDSGYMARVAFIMDKLLRKIGLSGRSFVPMLIGFGCSVPAIMSARTLSSSRDRRMTILLVPFMSCSAKLPIYALFTAVFFPNNAPVVMICLYIGGIIMGILSALLFKNTIFKGKPVPFVMELPAYRFPSAKNVILHMWEKAKDFLVKAFTVIFIANIIIWILQSFDWGLNLVSGQDSMLAAIGRTLSVIFKPLGFGDWRAATALITGLSAKEAVISTLAILTGSASASQPLLQTLFTSTASVISFLTFTLLYMPCVAAFTAMKREIGKTRYAVFAMCYYTGLAWVMSFIVYHIALLF
ncbi:MAG: ferrous iron transport protein B [Clostridiales bacterium]|nr:MAG: ferrous iron transport protein B [Clostridiales bacterium]